MLDIKFIRENEKTIKQAVKNKKLDVDIDELLKIDEKRRELIQKSEAIKAEQKKEKDRGKALELKNKFKALDAELSEIEKEYLNLMVKVPTIASPDTPLGNDASENTEVSRWGDIPKFDFKPKDHITLGESLDIIDFERGVKVAGYRGYYLKNEGAILAMALMMFALNKMIEKGYKPIIPPTLIKEFALFGSGYFKGIEYNPETDEIYEVKTHIKDSEDQKIAERRFLVGTAEPSLLAYYSGEILEEKNLPIKLCGFSQCYRSEIGSYGKDTKGLYRVHEFMKIEQVVISKADIEESDALQQEMVGITKEIHEELGLPYRVIQICTGDLSAGKYKQYDYEAWLPGMERWAETGSASNFLDWQARRLNIKYIAKDGKKYAYLLNNTALPTPRPIIAILENYQQKDGSVKIPEVLQKYTGFKEIKIPR